MMTEPPKEHTASERFDLLANRLGVATPLKDL
jgi:hypothetical protein